MNIIALVIGALMVGAIYSVVAMGYSLIYKSTGLMNLSQGTFMMLGAYVGVTFFKLWGLPYWLAVVLTMIVMFLWGYFLQTGLVNKLMKLTGDGSYIILLTSAVAIMVENGAQFIWGLTEIRFPSLFKNPFVTVFGAQVAPEQLLVLGICAVAVVVLYFFLNKTKFGTAIRAEAMDATAASSMGINVPFVRGFSWGLSACLCGLVGVAVGPVYGVFLGMGSTYTTKGYQSAVLGGYGNVYGALIGGMFFGFLETFVSAYITSQFKDVVSFVVLLLVLTFMPTGITKEPIIE